MELKNSIIIVLFLYLPNYVILTSHKINCVLNNDKNCTLPIEFIEENDWKENFNIICDESYQNKTEINSIKIPTIQNHKIYLNNLIKEICPSDNVNHHDDNLFGWIPFKEFEKRIEDRSNTLKSHAFIAKFYNSDSNQTLTENLCIYNIEGPEKCKHLTNFSIKLDINKNFEILINIIPVRYEIHNIKFPNSPENITIWNKSPIGNTIVENIETIQKDIFVIMHYSYMEKILLDNDKIFIKTFNNNNENNDTELFKLNKNLTFKLEYEQKLIGLNKYGIGNLLKMTKYNFTMNLPPKSEIPVQLIGQWQKELFNITADLLIFYGNNILKRNQIDSKISITRIINPELVYDEPVPLKNESSIFVHQTHRNNSPTHDAIIKDTINNNGVPSEIDVLKSSEIYPGFFPYFIISCGIVMCIAFVIFGNMIKIIIEEKHNKNNNSGESLLPINNNNS